jgi:GNAT superfamily N-acetyltransferase
MPRIRNIAEAVRHGLVTKRLLERLHRAGLHVDIRYLFREGGGTGRTVAPELTRAYPTSVLDPEELCEIQAHSWASRAHLEGRIAKGHLCIVGRHEGEIVGYTWADPVEVNDRTCDHRLEPGEAYLYDAYVVPEHRGRGLAPYLRQASYEHLRSAGFRTFYSLSDYFNQPAIRFKKKLGAVPIRLYLEVRVRRRRLVQWKRDLPGETS